MPLSRDNHYVPQWYQDGFLDSPSNELHRLDLTPDHKTLPDGRSVAMNSLKRRPTSKCFHQYDLYSTFFGVHISDEIERKLFGNMDDAGPRAVRAFSGDDKREWHRHFQKLFEYIDIQKIRTPKGLDWIKSNYPDLTQNQLMQEMQSLRNMHCTFWTEGVREIVSAACETKFIVSDHPVTVYNWALPPDAKECAYPNDPSVAYKGSQTLFPLNQDQCLILTNLEYAKAPDSENPTEKRTHAKGFRNSMVRTDAFIKARDLSDQQVVQINYILKSRARRYIAAGHETQLYPEEQIKCEWADLRHVLLPPEDELWQFGGELYAGFNDGRTYYQDEFGRTKPENPYLKKEFPKGKIRPNSACGCGSGKKFKKCCSGKPEELRTSWDVLSIRERNMAFMEGVENILGLNKGKSWEEVRRDLSDDHVKKIYELFAFFWPIETEIFDLLPKPDGTARALYSGIVDPRTISTSALALAPYFDEIIIQNPMMNANSINRDFSPVEKPKRYKEETLKQILLLIQLMPFIDEGFVNYIPDPCTFDRYLQRQMMGMADVRRTHAEINEADEPLFEWMARDNFNRSIWSFPEAQRVEQIRRADPEITDDQLQELLNFIEEQKVKDPLALLQDYELDGEQSGQMMMFNMTPNFEMSLYICQVTGAFLVTDSHTRWDEFMQHQSRSRGMVLSNLSSLTKFLGELSFPFAFNPEKSFEMRQPKNLSEIRGAVQKLYSTLVLQTKNGKVEEANDRLQKLFEIGHMQARRQFENYLEWEEHMKFVIPEGGFTSNDVQRLLVSSGAKNFMNFAPMAILLARKFPTN